MTATPITSYIIILITARWITLNCSVKDSKSYVNRLFDSCELTVSKRGCCIKTLLYLLNDRTRIKIFLIRHYMEIINKLVNCDLYDSVLQLLVSKSNYFFELLAIMVLHFKVSFQSEHNLVSQKQLSWSAAYYRYI